MIISKRKCLIYQKELFHQEMEDLFRQQISTDIVFQFCQTQVRAHRAIVSARCQDLAIKIINANINDDEDNNDNNNGNGNGKDEEDESENEELVVDLSDCRLDNEFYGDEHVLSALIQQCYGISYYVDNDDGTRKEIAGHDFITLDVTKKQIRSFGKNGTKFWVETSTESVTADIEYRLLNDNNFDHYANAKIASPWDLEIVGRDISNTNNNTNEWSLGLHSSILCAHSDYAQILANARILENRTI